MNKKIFTANLLVFIALSLSAQSSLSIDDYLNRRYSPDSLHYIQWIQRSDDFTYVNNKILYQENVKSNKPKAILTLDELKSATGLEIMYFPLYKWVNEREILIQASNILYYFDTKSKTVKRRLELPQNASDLDFSRNGSIAFVVDSNLYVADPSKKILQITDTKRLGSAGLNAYRREFGCSKGTFWNRSSTKIAFYEKSDEDLKAYPFVDYSVQPAKVTWYRYPFAGQKNEKVKIGIYNLVDSTISYLNLTKGDIYYTGLTWHPDGNSIFITEVTRNQKKATLVEYDVKSGEKIREVFSEESEIYVEPEYPMMMVASKNTEFIWLSRRDGYRHLYIYDIEGELLNPLTTGEWEVTQILGFDDKYTNVYFIGTEEGDYLNKYIYKADVISWKVTKLSKVEGVHSGIVNGNGYVIDLNSNMEVPYSAHLLDPKGVELRKIKQSKSPIDNKLQPKIETGSFRAADGKTELPYSIFKPADFDESKKYPAIMYVYGGPHVQLVQNCWMTTSKWFSLAYLASKGYIVFVADNRGSDCRGFQFESITHKQLGKIEAEDQLKALETLNKLKYVDSERIGIMGASYGGFMSLTMLCDYPEHFKAGVSSFPVTDWSMYEIMYTERYMETPETNYQGYFDSNVINKVKNLTSATLVISGGQDNVTVNQHAKSFVNKCIELDKPIEHFEYSKHEHGVSRADFDHYLKKIEHFFEKNL